MTFTNFSRRGFLKASALTGLGAFLASFADAVADRATVRRPSLSVITMSAEAPIYTYAGT